LLRQGNVIENRRAGKQVFYGLNSTFDANPAMLAIDLANYDVRVNRKTSAATIQPTS